MTQLIAIGNRQGGVGKSTVTMVLAHSLAAISHKKVLVIDLDTQCNSSFALAGSEATLKAHKGKRTLSHYMDKRIRGIETAIGTYCMHNVSDVDVGKGLIHLIPSSIDLDEDISDAICESDVEDPFNSMHLLVREMIFGLSSLEYDIILFDCPPGLSPFVNAAINFADRVVIPFRPDYISQYAVDRMASKVERAGKGDKARLKMDRVPHDKRRYKSLVNLFGNTVRENRILEEFDGVHPRFETKLARLPDVAEAFYWQEETRDIEGKYLKFFPRLQDFHFEFCKWIGTEGPINAAERARRDLLKSPPPEVIWRKGNGVHA